MGMYKRIVSVVLSCFLFFTGLPTQFVNFGGIPHAYAESDTSVVDIRYDDFSDTENLQLKGENLIKDSAIQFRSIEGTDESVFTKDKLTFGESLCFSTEFSYRYISPSSPTASTNGGFAFTLRQVGNSEDTGAFDDESISPGLSIAFPVKYRQSGVVTSLTGFTRESDPALMSKPVLAAVPSVRCEVSAVVYINGEQYIEIPLYWYNADKEPSGSYRVWIGYYVEEEQQILHSLMMHMI